ncbi:MAG: ribonuclease P protein component [Bacteroidales bacterium]|jgi:ribonuclease P protein component|nr:ribonuclease P protein component [Bacteroidales bacterium]
MYTFTKKERLNSKKNISSLFETGTSFFSYPFKVYYHFIEIDDNKSISAVLFSVGKKQFKLAIDRNRVKRLCREAYRLNKSLLIDKLIEKKINIDIAFVYVGKTIPEFKDLEAKMQKVLLQLSAIEQNGKTIT